MGKKMKEAVEENQLQADLEDGLKRYLKANLKHVGITYDELAEKLTKMGWKESKASIASKLGRGSFSATFFIVTMKAIGRESINLAEI